MKKQLVCQSCTMPIDDTGERGTEKDGSKSELYCRYCYKDGQFTDPGLTFEEMTANVIKEMEKEKIPAEDIQVSLNKLSELKRWKKPTGILPG